MNEQSKRVSRESDQPLYLQIVAALEHRVSSGNLKFGDMLPSESNLMDEFGVSRITVRQALAHLESRDLIVRRPGKGTFLKAPELKQHLNREAKTIVEVLRERGIEPDVTILGLEQIDPPTWVRDALGTGDEPVTRLRRVYKHEGLPIALVYLHLPLAMSGVASVLARDDHLTETTYTVFENELHVTIKEAKHVIHTVELDAEAAQALDMKAGEPCMVMDRVTYADHGGVIEIMRFYYPTDRFRFEITLPRHATGIALKMSEA